ncbi:MAG: hypothetical protein WCD89_15305 [Anaerocolumna sp.]
MNTTKLSKNQLSNLYEKLTQISKSSENKELGKENEESDIKRTYSLSSSSGKQLYKSLSDQQLLHVITVIAKEVGHSPSQKEVFWIWREYIKLRFKKWPYALSAAGLAKNAGKGGLTLVQAQAAKKNYDQLVLDIREKAKVLGRIPHPRDLPEVCDELGEYIHTWQEAIIEAGLDQNFFIRNSLFKIDNLEKEYRLYLQDIATKANLLGRAPLRNEIEIGIKEKLIERCGTWRNTLYQIGLEPVTRITPFSSTCINNRKNDMKRYHRYTLYDCYYEVLNLDMQAKNDLMYIKTLSEKRHHLPQKNEVTDEIRQRLQQVCGSWSNALYQLRFLVRNLNNK